MSMLSKMSISRNKENETESITTIAKLTVLSLTSVTPLVNLPGFTNSLIFKAVILTIAALSSFVDVTLGCLVAAWSLSMSIL